MTDFNPRDPKCLDELLRLEAAPNMTLARRLRPALRPLVEYVRELERELSVKHEMWEEVAVASDPLTPAQRAERALPCTENHNSIGFLAFDCQCHLRPQLEREITEAVAAERAEGDKRLAALQREVELLREVESWGRICHPNAYPLSVILAALDALRAAKEDSCE